MQTIFQMLYTLFTSTYNKMNTWTRNLFQNKPDFVRENRVRASYWTWRNTSKMAMRSAWWPVLSSWTCLLPTTRSTTDASSARCYRWLATYTWATWYAPCWKADASSWCWTRRRAVGDDNETDYQQGSVLAPMLFNIYTNDQPIHADARSFIYADDLCIASQGNDFSNIEASLTVCPDHYDYLLRHEPSACEPFKDTGVCFPSKEPRSQTRTECSVERYQTFKHNNTSVSGHPPWPNSVL